MEMNLFWLGVGGGSLLIIHALILIFLRWRTGIPAHGILSVPRFELFLLILTLPCISQSSAFVIRGNKLKFILLNFKSLCQACDQLKTTPICRWYIGGDHHWGFVASHTCSLYSISVPFSHNCNIHWQFFTVQGSEVCSYRRTMVYKAVVLLYR